MLMLTGTIYKVTPGGLEKRNPETGEIHKSDPYVYVLHSDSDDPNSEPTIEKIKIKLATVAESFKRNLGKEVTFPVKVYSLDGGNWGFYLPQGVLPTLRS